MVKRILNRDVLRYTQSARILQIKLLTNHSPLSPSRLKVNNGNRTKCKICSKLTIKTPKRRR